MNKILKFNEILKKENVGKRYILGDLEGGRITIMIHNYCGKLIILDAEEEDLHQLCYSLEDFESFNYYKYEEIERY